MEILHQSGDIIAQRYRIKDTLGVGGVGTTYEAFDIEESQLVALKVLSLRRMADWKVLELFEREARILSALNHPAIPGYLNYFQVDTPSDRSFYIAQQLAQGKSLAVLVENGWQPDEIEVRHLAIQLLEILVYLHSLTPPVIHRDIKPQNIILNEDGQIYLVDFGAVQDVYHNTVTGGSTVVGTYGYMAPEQFRGQAVLSTDLYGLGTTLLFLLTGKSPADLPQRQLKINFRSFVRVSNSFGDWLDRMLEPVLEDRFHSAQEALSVLRGEQVISTNLAQIFRHSKHSRVALLNTQSRLVIEIPPVWLRSDRNRFFNILTFLCKVMIVLLLLLLIICNLGVLLYNFSSLLNKLLKLFFEAGIIFISAFGLMGLLRIGNFLLHATSRTWLEIDQENFLLKRFLLGLCYQKVKGRTQDINQVKLSNINLLLNKKNTTICVLREKLQHYRFGSLLTEAEKEWLVGEINDFLLKMRSPQ